MEETTTSPLAYVEYLLDEKDFFFNEPHTIKTALCYVTYKNGKPISATPVILNYTDIDKETAEKIATFIVNQLKQNLPTFSAKGYLGKEDSFLGITVPDLFTF